MLSGARGNPDGSSRRYGIYTSRRLTDSSLTPNPNPYPQSCEKTFRSLTMEYLAQELIDEIIDHVPRDRVRVCSLVARNWRRRSQQRHFETIWLTSETRTGRWYSSISQDPEGIPSYVRFAHLSDLHHCREPGMLNRILRCFVNLRSLRLVRVELSLLSEQQTPILFDNFGRGLTQLSIDEPVWMYGTFLSLILSLPSLQTLVVFTSKQSGTPRFTLPKVPKRVLKELWIYGGGSEVATALARCQLSFQEILIRRLPHVNPPTGGLPALLTASSEVVRKVVLRGKSAASRMHHGT